MTTEGAQPDSERAVCSPCRGTGKVISNLGGDPREVTCPWCEGSGQFKAQHDAQEQAPIDARAAGHSPRTEPAEPA